MERYFALIGFSFEYIGAYDSLEDASKAHPAYALCSEDVLNDFICSANYALKQSGAEQ